VSETHQTLRDLDAERTQEGTELAFAELEDAVRDRLRRYGINDAIGDHRFFPTLGVAVATYLHETWVDWLN
jgi:MFS superfamily sulfate permease-like transporter